MAVLTPKSGIKMIIERIIKALLKSKIIYNFELICSHGLVSGITMMSIFLLMRLDSVGLAKSLVLNAFVFVRKYVFFCQ